MLAKIGSGASGIAQYLETGRKAGREFHRNLIDDRITLQGNLSLTDMIIAEMETAQDGDAKYLHITLGFAESYSTAQECGKTEINIDTIRHVTEAYRESLMIAYDPAEYAFYAEAHIPKVTHFVNEYTGELETRLPHVHIVIPMRNLVDGKYLNPLGYGMQNLHYHDAIQEKINADHQLRSPRETMRTQPLATHALARHNGKIGEQSAAQIKQSLQDKVAAGEIRSFAELGLAAEAYGTVKIRNGKDGDYLNVKPAWAAKGINIKEFTRQNFDAAAKAIRAAAMPAAIADSDDTRSTPINVKEEISETNERPVYQNLAAEHTLRARLAGNLYQSHLGKDGHGPEAESVAGMRNLSSVDLVHQRPGERRGAEMLVQPHAPDRVGEAGGASDEMRWPRAGNTRSAGEGSERAIAGLAPADHEVLVRRWRTRIAHEVRYVTSGNRDIYKSLNEAGKLELLRRKRADSQALLHAYANWDNAPDYDTLPPKQRVKAQLEAHRYQSAQDRTSPPIAPQSLHDLQRLSDLPNICRPAGKRPGRDQSKEQLADAQRAAQRYQSGLDRNRPPTTARCLNDLQRLSGLPHVDRPAGVRPQPDSLYRPGHANGTGPKRRWDKLDRTRQGAGKQRFREETQTVPATLQRLATPKGIDPDKLKFETSPSLVLAEAARRFGIRLEDYSVTSAKDGTPRIRHQNTHYNLGDFLTKHIGISWTDAQSILADCYHATLSDGLPPPDQDLWRSFAAWRERDYAQPREVHEARRAQLREEFVRIRNEYKSIKINSRGLKGKARQAMLAQARAEQLVKLAAIKLQQQQAATDAKRPSRNALYRTFLNDLASAGNLHALAELRRMAPPETDANNMIAGAHSATVLPLPSYKIDHTGRVTYYHQEIAVVTDSQKGVSVVNALPNAYDIALKVAVARYGRDLTFNGDELFMKNMIAAAKKSGMDLLIRNANKPEESPLVVQKPSRGFSR